MDIAVVVARRSTCSRKHVGAVIVREAGGFVGTPSGGDEFMTSGNIVAANTKVFKLMVQHLRPHLTKELR